MAGRIEASRLKLEHPALTLDFSKPFLEPEVQAEDSALPLRAEVKAGKNQFTFELKK